MRRLLLIIPLLLASSPANAFYEFQSGDGQLEARGFMRLMGGATDNPDIPAIYENKGDTSATAIARLMVDGFKGESLAFELNILASYHTSSRALKTFGFNIKEVERASTLQWSYLEEEKSEAGMEVDRMNVRLSYHRMDLTLGRQAINLATTFYFSPNDFFAPFTAQTFYRQYKPGVDAARMEVRLGELTQLSVIGVIGYSEDANTLSGWSDEADWERASGIIKISTVSHNFEWSVIGGSVRGADMTGGSIQGELWWRVGLRVEGHQIAKDSVDYANEISIELDRRFESSLTLRLAYFYHGAGSRSVEEYFTVTAGPYMGREYAAIGFGYEFTPLLRGDTVAISNLVDNSWLISLNVIYSLNDEAELSIEISVPNGETPGMAGPESEYGIYPKSISMELRSYF